METSISKQEIILVTNAFSNLDLCDRYAKNNYRLSRGEQLEEACWNGLLDDLLTGIVVKSPSGKRLSIWQIRQGKSLLEIELCDYPQAPEKHLSIDPFFFMPTMNYN